MKSFMKDMRGLINQAGSRAAGQQHAMVGKMMKIGPYSVRVEAFLAEGGFAQLFRVKDTLSGTSFALKHMRLAGEGEALADCHAEVDSLQQLKWAPASAMLLVVRSAKRPCQCCAAALRRVTRTCKCLPHQS